MDSIIDTMSYSKPFFICLSIFLLAGCTSEQSANHTDELKEESIIIPFEITPQHNMKFEAVLNGIDTVSLYFDTGGTELVMKHDAIKANTHLLDGRNANYSGEDYDPLEALNKLALGNLSWDSLSIYPVSVGPDMDGHFGWDLFEGKIIELDYEKQQLIVHSTLPAQSSTYEKLPIEYTHTLFCIQANVRIADSSFINRYLFDTGFQRAVVMDKDLRAKNNFPDTLRAIKESKLRNSSGDEFINQVVMIDALCFGGQCTGELPVQLFDTPNPARFETHILGGEVLKRFNTILDFKNHFVYLKPNSLMNEPYDDMKVSKAEG